MTTPPSNRPPTLLWIGGIDGHLQILDQRKLPTQIALLQLNTIEEAWHAIKTLAIRGAPAIGVAAAYAMVLAARTIPPESQAASLIESLQANAAYLKSARPTAVNLAWAVDRILRAAEAERGIGVRALQSRLLQEAHAIRQQDLATCLAIGRAGLQFIKPHATILTHCNAGALAASDHGTALAILYEAHRHNIPFKVFADETRPLLQGARLTAWELTASGIDVTLITDSTAALVMQQKKINLILVGADRIARNGDTANKIGTYALALLAKAHQIPFYVAAPFSTFDLSLPNGDHIPIEERPPEEITTTPGLKAYNPAFDITPAHLITALITDRGVITPVNEKTLTALMT